MRCILNYTSTCMIILFLRHRKHNQRIGIDRYQGYKTSSPKTTTVKFNKDTALLNKYCNIDCYMSLTKTFNLVVCI